MEYSTFGKHAIVDTWGVDYTLLNDISFLQKYLIKAAEFCGANVLSVQSHQFEPQGVTVLVTLSESHISIHTYPEKGFAALDCYTCGTSVDPIKAILYMLDILRPKEVFSKVLIRGKTSIKEDKTFVLSS